jgi:hypothetical protein
VVSDETARRVLAAERRQAATEPAGGDALLLCARCGARWLDTVAGRAAHLRVFAHVPQLAAPAEGDA